jgi:hypothetical protein
MLLNVLQPLGDIAQGVDLDRYILKLVAEAFQQNPQRL